MVGAESNGWLTVEPLVKCESQTIINPAFQPSESNYIYSDLSLLWESEMENRTLSSFSPLVRVQSAPNNSHVPVSPSELAEKLFRERGFPQLFSSIESCISSLQEYVNQLQSEKTVKSVEYEHSISNADTLNKQVEQLTQILERHEAAMTKSATRIRELEFLLLAADNGKNELKQKLDADRESCEELRRQNLELHRTREQLLERMAGREVEFKEQTAALQARFERQIAEERQAADRLRWQLQVSPKPAESELFRSIVGDKSDQPTSNSRKRRRQTSSDSVRARGRRSGQATKRGLDLFENDDTYDFF